MTKIKTITVVILIVKWILE